MQDIWDKRTKELMFSPAAFTYARSESTQTAFATIGKGEITVRNNPGQSLEGLNRDPNNAMQTNSSQDFNFTVSPLFGKISDALGLYGYPATLNNVAFWLTDPKGAWSTTKTRIEKSLPFLKPAQQPSQPQTDTQH
ncbi:chitosanase [Desulfovibrio desulfuricans]|nr:chitosanase [Desulfovibrio desulfuricans]